MPRKPSGEPYQNVPKGYSKQVGSSLSYWASSSIYGFLGHPEYLRIAEYERAMTTDETVGTAIEFIKLSILASLGEYIHPNPKIQEFVNENLRRMQGNYKRALGELIVSALWSGYGVSETVYKPGNGRIWIDYIANYNPRTVSFHVNQQGRLTDGEPSAFNAAFSTGIWQDRIGATPVRLPMDRCCMITHNMRYNNYYGESAIKRVYKNWRLKEATLEMWSIALDRYGTPVVYAIVPNGFTGRQIPDLANPGNFRPESIADSTEEAIANIHTGTGLVVEQPSPQDEIKLGTLTTGNNFGDAFIQKIQYLNRAIYRGMLIPALLLQEQEKGGLGGANTAAVHFEVYKLMLAELYAEMVEPFVEQVIGRLIMLNFGDPDPGQFVMAPSDSATAMAMATVFQTMTEIGVLDMTLIDDINHLRAVSGLPALKKEQVESLAKANKAKRDAELKQLTAAHDAAQNQLKLGQEQNKQNGEKLKLDAEANKAKLEHESKKMEHERGKAEIELKKGQLDLKKGEMSIKKNESDMKKAEHAASLPAPKPAAGGGSSTPAKKPAAAPAKKPAAGGGSSKPAGGAGKPKSGSLPKVKDMAVGSVAKLMKELNDVMAVFKTFGKKPGSPAVKQPPKK